MTPTPNFDRVARIYRWSEYLALGPLLERTRFHFLPRLRGRQQALALGDGDGRFLARLLAQETQLRALAVDSSAVMLSLLRKRCDPIAHERLATSEADALTIQAHAATDLIVTHFFLDCLTQPEVDALTARLAAFVPPGCLWLVSDFAIPRNALRPFAAVYIRALYLAFRILTGLRVTHLPHPQTSLTRAGFSLVDRKSLCFGLLYTELWQREEFPIPEVTLSEVTLPESRIASPVQTSAAPQR